MKTSKVSWILLAMTSLLLTGCGILSPQSPTPLPTVVLDRGPAGTPLPSPALKSGGVIASGVLVPAQQAQLAAPAAGNIKALNVALGEPVKAGQVLASLAGSEKLTAALQAANLELLSAQQALATLNQNAAVASAQAQQNLANAVQALKDAQDERYRKNLARVSQSTIDQAQADLVIARDGLKTAQEAFDKVAHWAENDINRAQAASRLAAAQQKVDQLQWNLDWLLSRPDPNEVQKADAAIALAQAKLAAAQRDSDRLKAGPDPDALALARARVENAQAQVAACQAALADLEIKAPFAGTVTRVSIHAAEWVLPGQALLTLADVSKLQVETTDLSERDIPRVSLGQKASVTIKSLNQTVAGKVSAISALADSLGGDVVYQTTIDLDNQPAGLRAGMSVEVQFLTE
jgi:multidrug efflux pump subunit AcrA (membrane-fusion protein)